MTMYNGEYEAFLQDGRGNACRGILVMVQTGSRIEGRYGFDIVRGVAPEGWKWPDSDATVSGEVLPDRTFPFQNVSDAGLQQLRQAGAPLGMQARIEFGGRVWYALMLDVNNRSFALSATDNVLDLPIPCWGDFNNFDLRVSDEGRTALRLRLLEGWAPGGAFRQAILDQLATWRKRQESHAALEPRRAAVLKDFSGRYTTSSSNSYTDEFLETTLVLEQSGGRLSGRYLAPREKPSSSVTWSLPETDFEFSGEVFPDQPVWSFANADELWRWQMDETEMGGPGGALEARIDWPAGPQFLMRCDDGMLLSSDRNDIRQTQVKWEKTKI